jgi:hypothetical protein
MVFKSRERLLDRGCGVVDVFLLALALVTHTTNAVETRAEVVRNILYQSDGLPAGHRHTEALGTDR